MWGGRDETPEMEKIRNNAQNLKNLIQDTQRTLQSKKAPNAKKQRARDLIAESTPKLERLMKEYNSMKK